MGSIVRSTLSQMSRQTSINIDPKFWLERTSVAALLFKVMPVDGEIHPTEVARLNRILADEYSISEKEVSALVLEAQKKVGQSSDIDMLSINLNASLSQQHKLDLISHMWEMVLADGIMHEVEVILVERVAELLGIDAEKVSALMDCHDPQVAPSKFMH